MRRVGEQRRKESEWWSEGSGRDEQEPLPRGSLLLAMWMNYLIGKEIIVLV